MYSKFFKKTAINMRAKLSLAIGYDEKDSGYVFDCKVVLP